MNKILIVILLAAFGQTFAFAEDKPETVAEQTAQNEEAAQNTQTLSDLHQELYKEFQSWYDKSLIMGEKGKEWIIEDIKNIGDWEYQVVTLNADNEERITEQLNKLGKGRWEVFWVQEKMHGVRFFLKRPVRTYLKHIPVSDLLQVIPKGEGE